MAATRVSTVIERLLEDDRLHEQVATGSARLRAAYRRTRALRAQEAAKDERLFEHVRKASEALTEAGRRALGKPEPEPPRRRGRRLAMLVVGVSVLALVRSMHRAQQAAAPAPAAPR